jgi:hypothetical protein
MASASGEAYAAVEFPPIRRMSMRCACTESVMDGQRFDRLVRLLGAPGSRRLALRAVLGGLAGPVLGFASGDAKKKKGKHKKKKCKSGTRKCGKACIPMANCCTAADCDDGETCQSGACTTTCVPDCTDKECGSNGCNGTCGNCNGNETCQGGQCVPTCTPDCAGKHCGDNGCGGVCGTCSGNATCQGGKCVDPPREICGIGYETCANSSDGCCVAGQNCCPAGLGENGCCGFDETCCPPNSGSPTYPDGECCDIGCPPSGSYCCSPAGGGGWCQIGYTCCPKFCCPPSFPVCGSNGCLAS